MSSGSRPSMGILSSNCSALWKSPAFAWALMVMLTQMVLGFPTPDLISSFSQRSAPMASPAFAYALISAPYPTTGICVPLAVREIAMASAVAASPTFAAACSRKRLLCTADEPRASAGAVPMSTVKSLSGGPRAGRWPKPSDKARAAASLGRAARAAEAPGEWLLLPPLLLLLLPLLMVALVQLLLLLRPLGGRLLHGLRLVDGHQPLPLGAHLLARLHHLHDVARRIHGVVYVHNKRQVAVLVSVLPNADGIGAAKRELLWRGRLGTVVLTAG
mmetsp:Transcript_28807/g.76892  ORF Transcript_28807/g.76892 Transcript_28807/m.76892 type:complete len:274 (-) Transcript_28807:141-962(-)